MFLTILGFNSILVIAKTIIETLGYFNIPLLVSQLSMWRFVNTSLTILFYHYWALKYVMSVYLNIVLPLLDFEICNVGIFKHYFTIIGL